jgi:hypothetical protein
LEAKKFKIDGSGHFVLFSAVADIAKNGVLYVGEVPKHPIPAPAKPVL